MGASAGVTTACAALLLSVAGAGDPFEPVRTRLRGLVAGDNVPSVAVAVGRGGRIIWSEGFGWADGDRRIAATARTPYSVASVTKPFTATALMILVERQQVDLDEPVTRYVGPLDRPGVGAPAAVTLRRTLGHVAGFPVHYQYFFEDSVRRTSSFEDTMKCFGAEIAAPGARYVYSNLGFNVLAEIVARQSGRSFHEFLRRELFAPLSLTTATIADTSVEVAGAATRYGTNGRRLPFYVTDHPGSSDLFVSAEDLVRFGLVHAGAPMPETRAVLTPSSIAMMQRPGPGDYGLGWAVNRNWHGRRVVWHSGGMPGSSAALWIVPSDGIAVAVVSNQFGVPVNQIAGDVLGALLRVDAETPAGPAPSSAPSDSARARRSAVDVGGRWRGTLSGCPAPDAALVEVRGDADVSVAVGDRASEPMETPTAANGRVSGRLRIRTPAGESTWRFDLSADGDRLAGPVTRTTSLGARGTTLVTLWADLAREQSSRP
jgi:CubicO group peptidase (beta-lactamase class C family)